MKKGLISTVLFLTLIAIISACGSSPQTGEQATKRKSILDKDTPIWVRTMEHADGSKVCAVDGQDTTEDSIMEDMNYAEDGARTKLGKSMETIVNASYEDYSKKMKASGNRYDERNIETAGIADTLNQVVAGAKRVDAWDNGKSVWVLVCIETEKFDAAIKNMNSMSEGLKEAVTQRAHNKWEELRKRAEEDKKQ